MVTDEEFDWEEKEAVAIDSGDFPVGEVCSLERSVFRLELLRIGLEDVAESGLDLLFEEEVAGDGGDKPVDGEDDEQGFQKHLNG